MGGRGRINNFTILLNVLVDVSRVVKCICGRITAW